MDQLFTALEFFFLVENESMKARAFFAKITSPFFYGIQEQSITQIDKSHRQSYFKQK
jgi:hypothetical protein